MMRHRLGIDCSGLVAWAAQALVKSQQGRSLWPNLRLQGHPARAYVMKRLRPVENISARVLTGEANTVTIQDLRSVRPGDFIRSLNGNHVLLITEVTYNARSLPTRFNYVNSTEYDGIKYGIRKGYILVKKPAGHILDQQWVDAENGVNWIFNAANNYPQDTRVVRLKMLDEE